MIRAILRAQWLSMSFSRMAAGRRGATITIILAALWYIVWCILSVATEVLAAGLPRPQIETWLPVGLLVVFLYWQLMPMASASMGASLDLRKLLLYPVPRGSLFLVEILLRIATCAELLLLLTGLGVGLMRNPAFGGWRWFVCIPLAVALFAAFNLLLAAGMRSLIERLLSRRGIREVVALVMMLAAVLPRLLIATGAPLHRFEPLFPAVRNAIWPWTAAARLMLLASPARAVTLAAWVLAAYVFGRWQFTRSLRYDIQAAQAAITPSTGSARTGRFYRLPSLVLPDPLGAMVEKELRSLLRTPRFRLVFVMGFSFGLLVWLPMTLRRGGHSNVSEYFLTLVSMYALTLLGQVTYWNAFGFDGSAAQIYFLSPVSIRLALAGKNIAAAIFIFLEIGAVSLACSLLPLGIPLAKIGEAFLVTAIAALYLLGIGNLGSVNYPRAMSAQRVSAGGARGRTQGLVFIFYPVALLPIVLAYLARYAFGSEAAFYVVLAGAAGLGVAVYYMATESAVSAARTRREIILAELSRGEGPMIAE